MDPILLRIIRTWILLGVVVLLIPLRTNAHHSLAEFDVDNPITLDGTLVKMEWENPHGRISLDVKGSDGKVVSWSIQTAAPVFLSKQGIRKTDLQPGMKLAIVGYPARNGSHKAVGRILTLPDGTEFFIR